MTKRYFNIILVITIIVMCRDAFWVLAQGKVYVDYMPDNDWIGLVTTDIVITFLVLITYARAFSKLRLYGPFFAVIILRIWYLLVYYDNNEFFWQRPTLFDLETIQVIGSSVIIIYYLLYLIDKKSRANKWLLIYGITGLLLSIFEYFYWKDRLEPDFISRTTSVFLSFNPILTLLYFRDNITRQRDITANPETVDDINE